MVYGPTVYGCVSSGPGSRQLLLRGINFITNADQTGPDISQRLTLSIIDTTHAPGALKTGKHLFRYASIAAFFCNRCTTLFIRRLHFAHVNSPPAFVLTTHQFFESFHSSLKTHLFQITNSVVIHHYWTLSPAALRAAQSAGI